MDRSAAMAVIPIFGGLLMSALVLVWPCQMGPFPRFVLAVFSACAAALLFALTVYFRESGCADSGRASIIQYILSKVKKS
jgi:hypothetical protein